MGSRQGIMMLIASLAGFGLQPAWAATPYPFNDTDILGDAALMPDWSATMQRQYEQTILLEACLQDKAVCKPYHRGVRHLLLKAAELPPERQIRLVNHYVNRKRYKYDRASRLQTPLSDEPVKYRSHWATVDEFIRRGGDCEDYATTKYFLLRQLGFDVDRLRIVVTYDRGARGYHAVLAVKQPNGKVLLLESDNLIRTGSRHGYRFIYSVNEKSIWDHESVSQPTRHQRERPA